MTNYVETIPCGPVATGDDILVIKDRKVIPAKLVNVSELLQTDIVTEIKSRVLEQELALSSEEEATEAEIIETKNKISEISYRQLDSKLLLDIKNVLSLVFLTDCWRAIKLNFSFKILLGIIIGILGGFDIFLKSYFVIAAIAVWFGIWADIKNKRFVFKSLVKKIYFQLALLAFIAVGNALTHIIALTLLEQLTDWKYIVIPICTLTNISYFLVSAQEIGLPIPETWVRSASWIKRFLA